MRSCKTFRNALLLPGKSWEQQRRHAAELRVREPPSRNPTFRLVAVDFCRHPRDEERGAVHNHLVDEERRTQHVRPQVFRVDQRRRGCATILRLCNRAGNNLWGCFCRRNNSGHGAATGPPLGTGVADAITLELAVIE